MARNAQNFFAFNLELSEALEEVLEGETVIEKRKACQIAITTLVQQTPVLTGQAKANWQIGVNQAPEGTFDSRFGFKFSPKTRNRALRRMRATRLENQVINEEVSKLKRIRAKDSIYIVNNLPYIDLLNSGSSIQSPNGMTDLAIEALKDEYE